MVSLTVSTPGKPSINIDFPHKHPNDVTIKELKRAVHAKFPKLVANRQRISLPVDSGKPVPLTHESKTLGDYGVQEGSKLKLKDLGKQVPYRMLYLWEYAGPIFLNPLFLHFSPLLWGKYEPSALQLAVRNITVLHFIKRFLESAFVHSFSRDTLPLAYVVRNCLYYWGVNGLLIGLTMYRPSRGAKAMQGSLLNSTFWLTFWYLFTFIFELLNLQSHIHLATLRVPAGQPRKYPTGFGFGSIVCANYFFETMGVIALVIMTGFDFGTIVYFCIATYFMAIWAGGKYRRYKKEMDPKVFPGKRWKLMPFIY